MMLFVGGVVVRDGAVPRADARPRRSGSSSCSRATSSTATRRCRRSSRRSKPLSFFDWTAGHRPIAGVTDWPSVAVLAAIDCRAVRRSASSRSSGATSGACANVGWLRLPSLPAGHRAGRSRGSWPTGPAIALAWGLGIGLYGVLIVASADAFSEMIASLPQIAALIEAIYPGLDLTQPSARAPADVLQLRLVHHRAGRRVVPRGLGGRRGPAAARGRAVDAAVARQLGGPQRARRAGRDRGRDRRHRACSSGSRSRSRAATSSTRSRASGSWGWRRPGSRASGSPSAACPARRWRAGVTGLPGHRHAPHRHARRGAQAARRGARPVALQAPRPADGRHLRPGRDRRRGGHGRRWGGALRVRPDAAGHRQVTSGGGTLDHRLVAVSAVLHLAWNVRLKTAGDPLRAATIGMLAASVGIVPLGVRGLVVAGPADAPAGGRRARARVGRRRGGVLHLPVGGVPARRPVGRLSGGARDGAAAGGGHRGGRARGAARRGRVDRRPRAAGRVPRAAAAVAGDRAGAVGWGAPLATGGRSRREGRATARSCSRSRPA